MAEKHGKNGALHRINWHKVANAYKQALRATSNHRYQESTPAGKKTHNSKSGMGGCANQNSL